MEKYAVIQFGGKQLKVVEGQKFDIEKQKDLKNDVLLYSNGSETLVGEPILKEVTVKLKKLEEKRDKKIRIGRYKSKSRYRKVKGHRQPISVIEVMSISKGSSKKTESKKDKETDKAKDTKKATKKKTKKSSSKKETK